jgi:hypothetical protein
MIEGSFEKCQIYEIKTEFLLNPALSILAYILHIPVMECGSKVVTPTSYLSSLMFSS